MLLLGIGDQIIVMLLMRDRLRGFTLCIFGGFTYNSLPQRQSHVALRGAAVLAHVSMCSLRCGGCAAFKWQCGRAAQSCM
jgi:hypothetical protein